MTSSPFSESRNRLATRLAVPGPRLRERAPLALAAAWLAVVVAVLATTPGDRSASASAGVAYMLPLAAALALIVQATGRRGARERLFLGSFSAFATLTLAGDVLSVATGAGRVPGAGPTASDVLWLAGYAALLPGAVVGLRPLGRLGASVVSLDAAIAAASVAFAGYVLLLAPALREPTAATLVAAAYPLLDLLALVALVPIVLGLRSAPRGARFLLGSFASAVPADAAYAYYQLHGGTVFDTWFVVCYQLQFVLLALGGLHAHRNRQAPAARQRRTDLGLPLTLVGFATTLSLLAREASAGTSTRPERIGFAVLLVLLIARMLIADRDLRRVEQAQRERGNELELVVAARTAELRQSRAGTIRRLAQVIGLRDEETGGHIERLGLYAALLAERVGCDPECVELLRITGPLHDIGKIAVPDAILRKPGPLTPDERTQMQRHTVYGHRLLSGSGEAVLDFAAELALTHHERWDGTGYPNGLAGDAIPFGGRILAICDVFDAITSDRVYRPAMRLDDALAVMRVGRGTQFDPELLDAFLAALPAVLALRERALGDGLEDVA